MSNHQSNIPRSVMDVPGCPGVTLTVYGNVKAAGVYDTTQGYFVAVNGKPTSRAELPADQKMAVMALLEEKFPEHARI
jgi:hypothetical protein